MSLEMGFVKEVGTRNWVFAVTGLAMLLFGIIWNTLGHWTKKAIGHFKSSWVILVESWNIMVLRII